MPMRPAAHGISSTGEQPRRATFIGKNRIEYATAYLRYEKGGKVQSLIHSLKYHDNKELGYLLGRQIARELQADHSPICTVDLLIPVPLHPRKNGKEVTTSPNGSPPASVPYGISPSIRKVWPAPPTQAPKLVRPFTTAG